MKNKSVLLVTALLFIYTGNLFAQKNDINFDNNYLIKQLNKFNFKIGSSQKTDSLFYYGYNAGEWKEYSFSKVISWYETGKIEFLETYFGKDALYPNNKVSKSYYSYYDNSWDTKHEWIILWNNDTQSWVTDTFYYKKKSLVKSIVFNCNNLYLEKKIDEMSWDFNENKYTGGKKILYSHINDTLYLEEKKMLWDTSVYDWKNSELHTFAYNGENILQTKTSKTFNETTNEFENNIKNLYTVSDNNIIEDINLLWRTTYWDTISKITKVFDERHNLTEQIVYSYQGNNEWKPYEKKVRQHTDFNKYLSATDFLWDDENNNWKNVKLINYTYNDAQKITLRHQKTWNNEDSIWENSKQEIYTYDEDGYQTHYLNQIWDIDQWQNVTQDVFTIYEYETEHLNQVWNSVDNIWENNFKYITYFSDMESEINTLNEKITVCPNPTNGFLNIKSLKAKINKTVITDLTGKTVKQISHINNNLQVDISNFKSGVYFIKIHTDEGIFIEKIIKK